MNTRRVKRTSCVREIVDFGTEPYELVRSRLNVIVD